jgi:hypothetical protein
MYCVRAKMPAPTTAIRGSSPSPAIPPSYWSPRWSVLELKRKRTAGKQTASESDLTTRPSQFPASVFF